MSGLATPAALGALALAIPILLTYMLRTRRPRQVVSSTFLWSEATRNVAATRPWQRLRPSILLFLQLLVLIALVLVISRPFKEVPGVGSDHLVLIVDASGSMLARDSALQRIEVARNEGETLIDTLRPGALVSIIAAQTRPRVLVSATADRAAALRGLDDLDATEGSAGFAEAFLLAESLETPGRPATIVIISDGGLTSEEARLVPPGAVSKSVGRSAANLALRRLDVIEGPSGFQAFAEVHNFNDRSRRVELTLEVDGNPVTAQSFDVPSGASVERSFDLGSAEGNLTTTVQDSALDATDPLPADDRAYGVLAHTHPRKIILVTPGNLFLESLVRQLPSAEVTVASAAPADLAPFDLAIFDRVVVPEKVPIAALYVSPSTAPAPVKPGGTLDTPSISYLAGEEPLIAQVDLSEVAVARAQRVEIPGSRTLVAGRSGDVETPLVSTWSDGTVRRAWIGFDLHESNLPLQVAFPILGDRLLSWLTGAGETRARVAGDPIDPMAPPGTTEVLVKIPGGRSATLPPGEIFEETERAGFYGLTFRQGDKVLSERTVALSFPPRESDLLPKGIQAPAGGDRPGLVTSARASLARWVLVAALILLTLEWWWANGRPGLRALRRPVLRRPMIGLRRRSL